MLCYHKNVIITQWLFAHTVHKLINHTHKNTLNSPDMLQSLSSKCKVHGVVPRQSLTLCDIFIFILVDHLAMGYQFTVNSPFCLHALLAHFTLYLSLDWDKNLSLPPCGRHSLIFIFSPPGTVKSLQVETAVGVFIAGLLLGIITCGIGITLIVIYRRRQQVDVSNINTSVFSLVSLLVT